MPISKDRPQKKKKPIVSVVVPVYNTEQYLTHCLESLIHQTYKELEIILINDGSTDQSYSISKEYQTRDSRIKIITKENEGHMYACRDGFQISTGQYIMFVDSDDWIDVHTVEICVDTMEKDQSDCVIFSYIKEYENRSIENPVYHHDYCFMDEEAIDKIHRRIVGPVERELCSPHKLDNMSTLWGKLYRREIVEKGRFVSERLIGTADDAVFNIYALKNCKKINYVNQHMYHYRKSNAQSITSRYNKALADKWDLLYEMIAEHLKENDYPERYWEAYYNRVACGMIGLGLYEVNAETSFSEKTKRIKYILNKKLYREAFGKLKTKYCPLKWKVFFFFCKNAEFLGEGVTALLYVMNNLRSKGSN